MMAIQTVRIERDDIAAVVEELARSLWVQETGKSPKASDVAFFELLSLCNQALNGRDTDGGFARDFVNRNFTQP